MGFHAQFGLDTDAACELSGNRRLPLPVITRAVVGPAAADRQLQNTPVPPCSRGQCPGHRHWSERKSHHPVGGGEDKQWEESLRDATCCPSDV